MGKTIIVIGGGPGGYAASLRASQLGFEVILAESEKLGGTCLNIGCVPTKSLLRSAEFYRCVSVGLTPGVKIIDAQPDWPSAQLAKEAAVKKFTNGIETLLRRSGVKVLFETATPLSGQSVRIGDETIACNAVILATGSVNKVPGFPGAGLPCVIDSSAALSLGHIPKSIVIIGGGVIGVEFASIFNSFGTKTTILEMTPSILPLMDADISEYMKTTLEAQGVLVHTDISVTGVKSSSKGNTVNFVKDNSKGSVIAEYILVAIGRQPNTSRMGLEELGIKMMNGAIITDEYCRTNIPYLYAVGDCTGKAMLAHTAMAQGETAAEHIILGQSGINNKCFPSCVYTYPEIASVGMTEKQAADLGIDFKASFVSLGGNAMATIENTDGFVKVIADKKLGEVLGVHMAAPHASEMISEAALCMSMEGTIEDIANTIHAHPSLTESLREAAQALTTDH